MSETTSGRRRAVAVFCGARKGKDPAFLALAAEVGRAIASRGWLLVYGGSSVGLMGEMANAALAAGGEVLGVIPQQLVHQEVGPYRAAAARDRRRHAGAQDADDRGRRRLPGRCRAASAPSTSLFEVVTLRQIGMHAKPIVLCDPGNYWGPMLAACQGLVDAGLANAKDFLTMEQFPTVAQALDRLAAAD